MKLTDPGLGSGTFPVYSLHFESCTSMYGPSKTLCTSEKAYWQMAEALIFFLKYNPAPQRQVQRTHSGLMIQRRSDTERSKTKTTAKIQFQTHLKSSMTSKKKSRTELASVCHDGSFLILMVTFSFLHLLSRPGGSRTKITHSQ